MGKVTLPPSRKPKAGNIDALEEFINRGGSPANEPETDVFSADPQKPKKKVAKAPDAKHINVRLNAGILNKIDTIREKRPRKPGSIKPGISIHDWIVEAVLEKLEKEGE